MQKQGLTFNMPQKNTQGKSRMVHKYRERKRASLVKNIWFRLVVLWTWFGKGTFKVRHLFLATFEFLYAKLSSTYSVHISWKGSVTWAR